MPGITYPSTAAPQPNASEQNHSDNRMEWWREARFGMFIHWGLYAKAAGNWNGKSIPDLGEWLMLEAKAPVADYAKLAQTFNPVRFDADQWVTIAKEAGMKYIVITAKHCEGFAMFHSTTDPFNIYDATPFKRDPLAELAAACKRQGMKLGFYYSQAQDWSHAGGAHRGESWDPAQDGSMDDYIKKIAIPQVKELLTNYGPVAVLWWDTPIGMNPDRAKPLAESLKLQPQIITNDRLGGGYKGDTGTPEGVIPPFPETNRDWETCMTINGTWGYRADAMGSVRSSHSLLLDLINTASKGGNYLLNVGPDAEGVIPPVEAERLSEMGKWLRVNGESIYGTSASPFRRNFAWGRITQKPFNKAQGGVGKLYLHVLNRPSDGTILVPIRNQIADAYLLADPGVKLRFNPTRSGMTVTIPAAPSDSVDTVVVAEIAAPLDIIPEDLTVRQNSSGTMDCDIISSRLFVESGYHPLKSEIAGDEDRPCILWKGDDDVLEWQAAAAASGEFDVVMNYASWPYQLGNAYSILIGKQTVNGVIGQTKSGYAGQDFPVGSVHLDKGQNVSITLKSTKNKQGGFCSFFRISLRPQKEQATASGLQN